MLKTMEKAYKLSDVDTFSICMGFIYKVNWRQILGTTEKSKNAIPKVAIFSLHCTSQSAPPSEKDTSGCTSI